VSQPTDAVEGALIALYENGSLREPARTAVIAFARAERAAGASPERVVILLKKAAGDAYYRASGSLDTRRLREDIVRWGIDAYFAD
jgi:cytochrome c-type biogenesis protein CcmH/NrfG